MRAIPNFPLINYHKYLEASKKNPWTENKSCRAGISLHKREQLIANNIEHTNIVENIESIIRDYSIDKNDEFLKQAFFLIQAWGGSESRHHSPQIDINWAINLPHYRAGVNSILTKNYILGLRKMEAPNIKGLGRSFATKHLCFWSSQELPIQDVVICTLLYADQKDSKVDPKKIPYETFLKHIQDKAVKEFPNSNTKCRDLEAALFHYSNYGKII